MTSVSRPAPKEPHAHCMECDLAVYCFTDPSTWVFRTMAELEEKARHMEECPIRKTGFTAPQ